MTMLRIIISIITIAFFLPNSFAQNTSKKKTTKVKMIKWTAEECDDSYDPYRVVNRISYWETINGVTSITVSFSENCCAEFSPRIKFIDNKLFLMPYKKYEGDYCECNCCYSINYELSGLENREYEVFFNGDKIELSDDYYRTVAPTDTVYNNTIINRTNKYGFKEGLWIQFYDDGSIKSEIMYPESSLFWDPDYVWYKTYNEFGMMDFYFRQDTTESWFNDGELQSQYIKYTYGDTTFEKAFRKYDNRQLKLKYLERDYPTTYISEFDSTKISTGHRWDYLYKEEYFENGQIKYLQGKDTNYTWYENGKIKLKSYDSGYIEYDENGNLIKRSFEWVEPINTDWRDLEYALLIYYYPNGNIKKINFVRDELTKRGNALHPGCNYTWTWDENCDLTDAPEKWNEPYPWLKFEEIDLPLSKYSLK